MLRRDMLKAGLAAAVVGVPTVANTPRTGLRVSCVKGDPGERLYAELCGDRREVKIFLDGVLQPLALTADEGEGIVVRHVKTPAGNIAFNRVTSEVFKETVRGVVRIEISPAA